ncbi:ParA family protein [Leptospira sp. 'Mane']|uniref:ParA family protein n=1 Tax=Leptospira sp. 'Mane' TaxID=3387407 RepID=UPI00398A8D11
MKIITIGSLKGGVGKTTLTVFLAQALQSISPKSKILLIDLDHNNNLTDYFLRDEDVLVIENHSVAKSFQGTSSLADLPIRSQKFNLDCIPTTPKLSKVSLSVAWDAGLQTRFRKQVRSLPYDYVLIDTPPALCLELNVGIFAADLVLTPIGFSRWNIQGYEEIREVFELANEALDKKEKIKILPVRTMVSEKRADAMDDIGIGFAKTFIPKSDSIAGAVDQGKALSEKNAQIFESLAKEIK